MKRIALFVLMLTGAMLFSQTSGQPVVVVKYPSETPTLAAFYDASNNLTYACYAAAINNTSNPANYSYSLSVTGGGLTSIVVLTNVGTVTTVAAHGLQPGQSVTVSGSTTPALNGNYLIQTTATTSTFTITTSGVGNATYNNGPLTVSGTAPLLTSPIWSIAHYLYDVSNNLIGTQCANGTCVPRTNICANRTALSYK